MLIMRVRLEADLLSRTIARKYSCATYLEQQQMWFLPWVSQFTSCQFTDQFDLELLYLLQSIATIVTAPIFSIILDSNICIANLLILVSYSRTCYTWPISRRGLALFCKTFLQIMERIQWASFNFWQGKSLCFGLWGLVDRPYKGAQTLHWILGIWTSKWKSRMHQGPFINYVNVGQYCMNYQFIWILKWKKKS